MKVARILPWLVMCVAYLTVSPGWAADPRLAPQALVPQGISSLTLNPSTVTGGTTQVLGTVTLLQPASSVGVMVTLRSSNLTVAPVPPSVTIQPGATWATFVIQPQPVSINPNVVNPTPPSVQISAQIGNAAPVTAQLTVLPPTLVALTLNPASVGGGSISTGTVTISGPAPSGGLVITLSSSGGTTTSTTPQPGLKANIIGQNPVTVPQQVTVPVGARTGSFPITTRPVTTSTPIQINAAWGTFITKTATLTLLPLGVVSLSFNPSDLVGGKPSTGTVTLTAPAPFEGIAVQLNNSSSNDPLNISNSNDPCNPNPTFPATVQIVGGATSATFPVLTYPIMPWFFGNFFIRAAYGNQVTTGVLHVRNTLDSLWLPQSPVKGGNTATATIKLGAPVPNCAGGLKYSLLSDNPILAQVASQIVIAPGATQATFTITTSAVTQAQTVKISATKYGFPATDYMYGSLTITP